MNFGLILLGFGGMFVMGIIMLSMMYYIERQTPSWKKEARLIISSKGMAKKLAQFEKLSHFWLTRGGLMRIHNAISGLSIYTGSESKVIALDLYKRINIMTIAFTVIGAIALRDMYNTILVLAVAIIMRQQTVDNSLNKIKAKMLNQLGWSVSSVRQAYLRLNSVPDAIAEAEVKPFCQNAFEDILQILTETDGENRLEEFIESNPYRITQTFGVISFLVDKFGDTEKNGEQSIYTRAVDMIESEIRLEQRKLALIKARFGSLQLLPIAVIPFIKMVEAFFMTQIPSTSVVYNGPIGYFVKTAVVITAVTSYVLIGRMNDNVTTSKDDRIGIPQDLLEWPFWKDLVITMSPKTYVKREAKSKFLRGAMSMQDIESIYSKKLFYHLVTFVAVIGMFVFATALGKEYIYKNVGDLSLVAGKPLDAKQVAERRRADEIYMAFKKNLSKNDAKRFVQSHFNIKDKIAEEDMVNRLMTKYDMYHGTHFKWYYVLIAYAMALAAWWLPELMLILRSQIIRADALEDVLQLQTLLVILAYTTVDTLEALYWLQKSSRVHSRLLMEAFQDYPSNPEFVLERLKVKSALAEMVRLVDKLALTINQLSLMEAFNDLISERDHMLRIRELEQTTTIERKRAIASPLAKAPLMMLIFLHILLPLGYIGVREFSNSFKGF